MHARGSWVLALLATVTMLEASCARRSAEFGPAVNIEPAPTLAVSPAIRSFNGVLFCPDRSRVVTYGNDAIARLWEVATGRVVRDFVGHANYIRAAAVSPDGKRLLTGSIDGTARLWDMETGRQLHQTANGEVSAVSFSPDGEKFLIATRGGAIVIGDTFTGHELELVGNHGELEAAIFSPKGNFIVYAAGNVARIWPRVQGVWYREFTSNAGKIYSIGISPDESMIAINTQIWDVVTGKERRTLTPPGGERIGVCDFSPDGKSILYQTWTDSADFKTVLHYADIDLLKEHWSVTFDKAFLSSSRFSADGTQIVTLPHSEAVLTLDALTGRQLARFTGAAILQVCARFSPDGTRIVTGGQGGAQLWDLARGFRVATLGEPTESIASVEFTGDGRGLVTASGKKSASLWDCKSRAQIKRYSPKRDDDNVYKLSISPDRKRLLLCTSYEQALVDAESGNIIETFGLGNGGWCHAGAVSPANDFVLLGEFGDVVTGGSGRGPSRKLFKGDPHQETTAITFSPDGKSFAAANTGQVVTIRDVEWAIVSADRGGRGGSGGAGRARTFRPDISLCGHTSSVNSVAYSPDGKRLLTASSDKTARLWDIATGKQIRQFTGHSLGLCCAQFSPDGRLIVTTCADGSSRLWNSDTGRELCSFYCFADGTWAVTAPDGRYDSSDQGDNPNLYWVQKNATFPVTKFKDRFYTPSLLAGLTQRGQDEMK